LSGCGVKFDKLSTDNFFNAVIIASDFLYVEAAKESASYSYLLERKLEKIDKIKLIGI
jgi:hypothetical protein